MVSCGHGNDRTGRVPGLTWNPPSQAQLDGSGQISLARPGESLPASRTMPPWGRPHGLERYDENGHAHEHVVHDGRTGHGRKLLRADEQPEAGESVEGVCPRSDHR